MFAISRRRSRTEGVHEQQELIVSHLAHCNLQVATQELDITLFIRQQDHTLIILLNLTLRTERPSLQREDDQHGHGGQLDGVLVHLAQQRRPVAAAAVERVLAVGGCAPDNAHVGHVRLLVPGGQRVDGAVHDVLRLDVPLPARGQRGPLALRPAPDPLQFLDRGHRGSVVGQRQLRGDHGQPARVGDGAPRRRLERRHAEGRQVLVALLARCRLRAGLLHGGDRRVGAGQEEEEGEEKTHCHCVCSVLFLRLDCHVLVVLCVVEAFGGFM